MQPHKKSCNKFVDRFKKPCGDFIAAEKPQFYASRIRSYKQ